MNRILSFLDAAKNHVVIEINNRATHLSITGRVCGCSGQCYDEIIPTPTQQQLIDFWKKHQLKSVGEPDLIELKEIAEQINEEEIQRRIKVRELSELHVEDDEHETDILNQLEKDLVYSNASERIKLLALAKNRELEYAEILEIEILSANKFACQGYEYYVGTEDELNEIAKDYLKDNKDLWQDAVACNATELGLEDWVDDVVDLDGFASVLNHWDGTSDNELVAQEWICICREC